MLGAARTRSSVEQRRDGRTKYPFLRAINAPGGSTELMLELG
jgi:hypothetical protein